MRWTKVEQQERYLQGPRISFEFQFGGVLYKDHFITLKKDPKNEKKTTVCCLNLSIENVFPLIIFLETKNTWTTFDVKSFSLRPRGYGLMMYNDFLLAFGEKFKDGKYSFTLAVLNLESKNN